MSGMFLRHSVEPLSAISSILNAHRLYNNVSITVLHCDIVVGLHFCYKRLTRVTDHHRRQLRRRHCVYSCELPSRCEYSRLMTFQYQCSAGHLARSCPYRSRSSYRCTCRNVCIVSLFYCYITKNNNHNNYKLRLVIKRHQRRRLNTMIDRLVTICQDSY